MKQKETTNRENLQKTFKSKIQKLKVLCNDAHHAEKLINDIISIKGQLDIKPTLVYLQIDDIVKEYDFGHFKLILMKNCIVVKVAGFEMVVYPMQQTLYGQLKFIINTHENNSELSDEEKDAFSVFFNATMSIIMTPLICFCDDKFWLDIATYIAKKQNEFFIEKLETPLQDETPEEDTEFNNVVSAIEDFKKEAIKEENGKQEGTENME